MGSFIFADLIIVPILLIHAKYYSRRMAWLLFRTFYAIMVAAGYDVELLFTPLALVPTGPPHAHVGQASITLNYTSVPNVIFLLLAAVLLWRFLLSMMGGDPETTCGRRYRSSPSA